MKQKAATQQWRRLSYDDITIEASRIAQILPSRLDHLDLAKAVWGEWDKWVRVPGTEVPAHGHTLFLVTVIRVYCQIKQQQLFGVEE